MKEEIRLFWKYRFLLSNLIGRDIKVKYRRSKLGILWSVLNPLLMMVVMAAVFSRFFKSDIPNYPVYLLCGQLLFTFFNESTTNAMGSVLFSSALIKKVYVPKYIFPLEKSCFSLVNLVFSLIALIIIMIITKAPIYGSTIFGIVPIFFLFFFCLGVGLFLSAAAIYFRDVMHFWRVILQALMYATPIFYPETIWNGTILQYIGKMNPMYWYITTFRGCVADGVYPSIGAVAICAAFAVVSLLIGGTVFKKSQDNFILYI